ncbi:protein ANTAGONIST OF LIKE HETEROCHROMATIN PROTEIN 1-like [Salvia divinorum]|uniref:Protein ANTAGONIST OF LIKE HETEROCHROMATIN PROTEIN 1-like n=1 Tax=Salvia divinorum TaxID=28513 RepID=A0ABD1IIZ0_SALDI
MARPISLSTVVYHMLEDIMNLFHLQSMIILYFYLKRRRHLQRRARERLIRHYSILDRIPPQVRHMNRLVSVSDIDCLSNLRMDRNTFGRLCILLKDVGGLQNERFVLLEEQVAIFLGILAHHKKNRVVGFNFLRSGETVSHYVHLVLRAILKLHPLLLPKLDPVANECTDTRWKHFKGCIRDLDGTYINVLVRNIDKPRYRTRKGQISTNTLVACDRNMRFLYFLPGWEGSAGDSRVLRDAVSREEDGLHVPRGNYFLCDNGYANSEGRVMSSKTDDGEFIPACACGRGKMRLLCAGKDATHSGRYFYKCSANAKHANFFLWCDEYHSGKGSGRIPTFVLNQCYRPTNNDESDVLAKKKMSSPSHGCRLCGRCQSEIRMNFILVLMGLVLLLLGVVLGKLF